MSIGVGVIAIIIVWAVDQSDAQKKERKHILFGASPTYVTIPSLL